MDEYINREELINNRPEGRNPKQIGKEEYNKGWNDCRSAFYALIEDMPAADVAPVRHGWCPVCSGNAVLTQDCDNGYSLEIDAEQEEASLWYGDACLAVFHIDFCPNCGAKMDGERKPNEA